MEWLFSLFVFGSLWFWILVVVSSVVMVLCVENDKGFFATITVLVTLALLHYLGGLPLWDYVKNNPVLVLGYALLYVAVGVTWSFAKWYFYSMRKRDTYEERKEVHLKRGHNEDDWKNTSTYKETKEFVKNGWRNKKEKITMWAALWPWSMLWTLMRDFVIKLFERIVRSMRKAYENVVHHVFRDFEKDFTDTPPPARGNVPN